VTNKTQSVINRKRLDQKVAALEEHCLKLFKEIAWARDQDRHDFERLVEIMAGLERVGNLQKTIECKRIDLGIYEKWIRQEERHEAKEPIWKRFLWRKS